VGERLAVLEAELRAMRVMLEQRRAG